MTSDVERLVARQRALEQRVQELEVHIDALAWALENALYSLGAGRRDCDRAIVILKAALRPDVERLVARQRALEDVVAICRSLLHARFHGEPLISVSGARLAKMEAAVAACKETP